MTKPSREPSRYDQEKTYHFEVGMERWISRTFFKFWMIEWTCWPKVTFQDRCLGFPNHPYFLVFMKMALIYDPLNDIDLFAGAPRSTMVTCEVEISPKRPLKINPPTKQRLFRQELGLILPGCGWLLLKISGTPQNLSENAVTLACVIGDS